MLKNILLTIEYCGKNYSGWQRQLNGVSVQEKIEDAIEKLTGQKIGINGSGRTDAKVNALGQCANFKIDCTIPPSKFGMALNSMLPEDIRIVKSKEVDMDFHARYNATGKHYRYTILNRTAPSAIYKHTTYHMKYPLDVDKMIKAGSYFVGKQDFRGFMSAGSKIKKTVRTIYSLDITKDGDLIIIDIKGNGFLYNMVRIIAGTLTEVGRGNIPVEKIKDIIQSRDRSRCGPTLKASGLCLMEVYYD
ncbi:MAG: tRNA pseudouridine synthase A [Firmicutes bacterium ADurb.Bin099]|nr:MAG: tRNA pseudouridine synthase A [Firmicutes bacterium ADurb.Bin099]